jgi:hypothetical protein
MSSGQKELNLFLEDLSDPYKKELLEKVIQEKPKNRTEMDKLLSAFRNNKKFLKLGKFTKNYWIQRGWSESEAQIKKKENKVNNQPYGSPMQKKYWMNFTNPQTDKKYTEREAEYKIKSQRKINIEYWIEKGQTEIEAIESVKKLQKENSKKISDKIKTNPENYRDRTWTQYKYWMKKGLSEIEAKEKVSSIQDKLSMEFLISKHGEIEAIKKYQEISESLSNSQKIESYIEKYGEEIGKERYREKIRKSTLDLPMTSIESIKFFIPLYKKIRKYFSREDIFWGIGGSKEYFLLDKDNSKIFFYDFTILSKKIIIEYHGKRWHPNPSWDNEKWNNWELFGLDANKKRSLDLYKNHIAEKQGFTVIEIFSDGKEKLDIDLIIQKILN